LLVAGLFWEKSTAAWWLISQTNRAGSIDATFWLLVRATTKNNRHVRLAYQPPASSTFLSEQTSHQQPASSTFLSE
jgi:hypothetical protein